MPEADGKFQQEFDQERHDAAEPTRIPTPGEPEETETNIPSPSKWARLAGFIRKTRFFVGRGVDKTIHLPGEALDYGVGAYEEKKSRFGEALKSEKVQKALWASFAIIGGALGIRLAWDIYSGLEKTPKIETGQARTTPESQGVEASNVQVDVSIQGLEGFNIEPLTDPRHGNDRSAIDLAARFGGPAGLLDTFSLTVDEDGKTVVDTDDNGQYIHGISEPVFNDISTQLNLDQAGETELRQIWGQYLANPETFDQNIFLNFLQTHGANPQVIEFYKYAMELRLQYPDTWQDRIEPLKNWEPKQEMPTKIDGKNEVAGQTEEVEPNENFYSVTEMVFEKISGGDFGEILGIIETAAHMDYSNPEYQTAVALDIVDLPDTKPQLSGFSPLPMVLTGLFLLRISPRIGLLSLPKNTIAAISEGIENVYYWFRMGQASRAVRDLVVMGNQFLKNVKK